MRTAVSKRVKHEDAPLPLLTNWAYDSIRDDPRFVQMLDRFNLRQGLKR